MFKSIWVLSLFIVLGATRASALPSGFSFEDTTDNNLRLDSTQKPDSIQPAVVVTVPTDPKEGFRDLFVSKADGQESILELNPLATSFVEDYMVRFAKQMNDLKGWGRPYFDMMDAILDKHKLPKELKYLAVIESNLRSNARSWAGAVGPWQFMPATARTMGLKVNRKVDERRDLYKSTHAAGKYLNSLFNIYGDWLLVIAAYNSGPGTVNAAIRRSGTRDFWKLQNYLPLESRNHVKKFIATHYMLEGNGGITTLTKQEAIQYAALAEAGSPLTPETISASISGRYNSAVLVKHIEMELEEFTKINPQFDKQISINGKYELRLPTEKMDLFMANKFDILAESVYLLLNNETASNIGQ